MSSYRLSWGFILLSLGAVLLANTLDFLPWTIWIPITQFWPLLLIVFGLSYIMVRQKTSYFLSLLLLGTVFVVAGYLVWTSYRTGYFENINYLNTNPKENLETTISQGLPPSVKEATVNIDFGASKIFLSSNNKEDMLVEGRHISNFSALEQSQRINNNKSQSTFKSKPLQRLFSGHNVNDLSLYFSQYPEYSFKINTGASSLELDFAELAVKELDLNAGAAKIEIFLSDKADFSGKFNLGASNIRVHIPKNVNLKIESRAVAASNNFSEFGLEKEKSQWVSQSEVEGKEISLDFEGAATKIELVSE